MDTVVFPSSSVGIDERIYFDYLGYRVHLNKMYLSVCLWCSTEGFFKIFNEVRIWSPSLTLSHVLSLSQERLLVYFLSICVSVCSRKEEEDVTTVSTGSTQSLVVSLHCIGPTRVKKGSIETRLFLQERDVIGTHGYSLYTDDSCTWHYTDSGLKKHNKVKLILK